MIIISVIITSPPIITICIFDYYSVLIIEVIVNTISCLLLIIISLKCGVWAADKRRRILDQERHKLEFNDLSNKNNISSNSAMINHYDKYDQGLYIFISSICARIIS